jgi:putative flavoprotein involved in K+ transport
MIVQVLFRMIWHWLAFAVMCLPIEVVGFRMTDSHFINSPSLYCTSRAIFRLSKPSSKYRFFSTRTVISASSVLFENDDKHESNPKQIAQQWLDNLQRLLNHPDVVTIDEQISQLFMSTSSGVVPFWRDMVAFTWNILTMEGLPQIADFVRSYHSSTVYNTKNLPIRDWSLDSSQELRYDFTVQPSPSSMEFWSVFETAVGTGRAHVRLLRHDHSWKAHTLLTSLQSLHDRPWHVEPHHRPLGLQDGVRPNRQYWHVEQSSSLFRLNSNDADTKNDNASSPYVIIIGAGQGGLSLAARLQALQVPYLILEAGPAPGTSWRNRYPSLHLHDPVYYNHMPYIPFPPTWPVFCPRNKIAAWMEFYAQALDLKVQCNTAVVSAVPEEDGSGRWKVDVEYRDPFNSEKIHQSTLQCYHIVFATGNSSFPRLPSIPGRYKGLQLHSSQYKGGKQYQSDSIRHVVVIGSNNSAFDICQDIWEQLSIKNGGSVETITMIQRTASMVVSKESVLKHGLGPLYSENAALHHEEADLLATTVPYKLAMERWQRVTRLMQETDGKMLDDLTKAGYRLDTGPNGAGIFAKSATEGGGFYIDHGCAELVSQGDVSVCFATVDSFEEFSVLVTHLDDGRQECLPSDMIVYASGFGTMDQWVAKLCGPAVWNAVGRTWGLGLGHKAKDPGPWEGELRNMWKPVKVDGLWFQGGNLAQSRHYSKYLALQLAARYSAIEITVYRVPQPTRCSS